jgi:hypothetical protein
MPDGTERIIKMDNEEQVFLPKGVKIVWFSPERPDDIASAETNP